MPTVIKTHTTEEPRNRLRAMLARMGRDHAMVETYRDLFARPYVPCDVFTYATNAGATIWCVEVERFGAPDVQFWECWQLDGRPTLDQIYELAAHHADAGSVV